jgi:N-acetylglucosaminyl-diphospho-decaprenol L-rhamnosyltransferase
MEKLKIAIVIVNYKTPQLVVDCVKSIRSSLLECEYEIIVVDNNSQDSSISQMGKVLSGDDISFIASEKNGGFSYGNNLALRDLVNRNEIKYLWLLNSDTLVFENSCRELIDFLERNQTAGIAGSRLEDRDGTPQISAFRDFTVMSEMLSGFKLGFLDKAFENKLVAGSRISDDSHLTDWIAGASMMIRREAMVETGLLDENYFLYFEEVDYCLRARRLGWECWYVPSSHVVHLVGATTGISDSRREVPRKPQYWFNSRRYFFIKNYGRKTLALSDFMFLLGYSFFVIRKKISSGTRFEPPFFLRDFYKNSVFIKGFKT